MTEPDRLPIDPAMARALDRFDVPPPDAGFLDRIAAMPSDEAPMLPPIPRRRPFGTGRRGAWVRRASIGVIALGLASATAAATGVFPQIRIALPAPIAAMLAPAPRPKLAHAHPHHHPVAKNVATVAAAPAPGVDQPILPIPDPVTRAVRREHVVAVIQNRLAARGIDVPKPVIRHQMAVRQIAIGAAIRGDTVTPLPPRMEMIRERAAGYLDAHPVLRDRLRQRAALVDKEHDTPAAVDPADRPAPATGTGEQATAPTWTERRLRQLRRAQMAREFWAAQRPPLPQDSAPSSPPPPAGEQSETAKNPSPPEGNPDAPR